MLICFLFGRILFDFVKKTIYAERVEFKGRQKNEKKQA